MAKARLPLSGKTLICLLAALVCSLTSGRRAQAQSWLEPFRLDRFDAAPSLNDGLALELPSTLGHLVPSVQVLGDYAHEPLLTEGFGSDSGDPAIVGARLNLHVLAALGLGERAEIFLRLPVTAYQSGDAPRPGGRVFDEPASAGLQDVALGGSVRLLGDARRGPQLGLHASLQLPLGSEDALASDGGVGARGTLSFAQLFDKATLALESGVTYRPERQYGFDTLGTEWLYRVGVHFPVGKLSKIMLELDGATDLLDGQFFEKDSRPLEALAGARVHLKHGVYGTLGAGLGLLSAPGVPLARGLLGVGWSPFAEQSKAAEPAEQPAPAEAVEPKPEQPRDDDADGIRGEADACPTAPEDLDGFEDRDGCPENDNDRDGVPDAADMCSTAPEDFDGDDDEDGCPESTGPSAAPEPAAASSGDGKAPEHVHFEQNHAGVSGRTRQEMRAVLEWLGRHPGTYTMRVKGHASAEGSETYNEALSRDRAQAVARYLDKHNVYLRKRGVKLTVEVEGRGSREPIAPNDTEEGRRTNRRVEFELEGREP